MDETQVTRAKNGAIRDKTTGKIIAGPKLDTTQAHALARTRWDQAAAAARQGYIDGINRSGVLPSRVDTPSEAWREITAHAAEVYIQTDGAAGIARLLPELAKVGDMVPDRRGGGDASMPSLPVPEAGQVILLAMRLVDTAQDDDNDTAGDDADDVESDGVCLIDV